MSKDLLLTLPCGAAAVSLVESARMISTKRIKNKTSRECDKPFFKAKPRANIKSFTTAGVPVLWRKKDDKPQKFKKKEVNHDQEKTQID